MLEDLNIQGKNDPTEFLPLSLVKKNYIRHQVAADGDCGYTSFGITRKEASNRINIAISNPEVKRLLKPAVEEALLTEGFVNGFPKESPVRKAYENYVTAATNRDSNEAACTKVLKAYAADEAVLKAYIQYDVIDKKIDGGWAHPSVLQTLAYLRGINLYLYQLDEEENYVPHQHYPVYCPKNATEVKQIVFVHGNHFELLEPLNEKKEKVYKPLDKSQAPVKQEQHDVVDVEIPYLKFICEELKKAVNVRPGTQQADDTKKQALSNAWKCFYLMQLENPTLAYEFFDDNDSQKPLAQKTSTLSFSQTLFNSLVPVVSNMQQHKKPDYNTRQDWSKLEAFLNSHEDQINKFPKDLPKTISMDKIGTLAVADPFGKISARKDRDRDVEIAFADLDKRQNPSSEAKRLKSLNLKIEKAAINQIEQESLNIIRYISKKLLEFTMEEKPETRKALVNSAFAAFYYLQINSSTARIERIEVRNAPEIQYHFFEGNKIDCPRFQEDQHSGNFASNLFNYTVGLKIAIDNNNLHNLGVQRESLAGFLKEYEANIQEAKVDVDAIEIFLKTIPLVPDASTFKGTYDTTLSVKSIPMPNKNEIEWEWIASICGHLNVLKDMPVESKENAQPVETRQGSLDYIFGLFEKLQKTDPQKYQFFDLQGNPVVPPQNTLNRVSYLFLCTLNFQAELERNPSAPFTGENKEKTAWIVSKFLGDSRPKVEPSENAYNDILSYIYVRLRDVLSPHTPDRDKALQDVWRAFYLLQERGQFKGKRFTFFAITHMNRAIRQKGQDLNIAQELFNCVFEIVSTSLINKDALVVLESVLHKAKMDKKIMSIEGNTMFEIQSVVSEMNFLRVPEASAEPNSSVKKIEIRRPDHSAFGVMGLSMAAQIVEGRFDAEDGSTAEIQQHWEELFNGYTIEGRQDWEYADIKAYFTGHDTPLAQRELQEKFAYILRQEISRLNLDIDRNNDDLINFCNYYGFAPEEVLSRHNIGNNRVVFSTPVILRGSNFTDKLDDKKIIKQLSKHGIIQRKDVLHEREQHYILSIPPEQLEEKFSVLIESFFGKDGNINVAKLSKTQIDKLVEYQVLKKISLPKSKLMYKTNKHVSREYVKASLEEVFCKSEFLALCQHQNTWLKPKLSSLAYKLTKPTKHHVGAYWASLYDVGVRVKINDYQTGPTSYWRLTEPEHAEGNFIKPEHLIQKWNEKLQQEEEDAKFTRRVEKALIALFKYYNSQNISLEEGDINPQLRSTYLSYREHQTRGKRFKFADSTKSAVLGAYLTHVAEGVLPLTEGLVAACYDAPNTDYIIWRKQPDATIQPCQLSLSLLDQESQNEKTVLHFLQTFDEKGNSVFKALEAEKMPAEKPLIHAHVYEVSGSESQYVGTPVKFTPEDSIWNWQELLMHVQLLMHLLTADINGYMPITVGGGKYNRDIKDQKSIIETMIHNIICGLEIMTYNPKLARLMLATSIEDRNPSEDFRQNIRKLKLIDLAYRQLKDLGHVREVSGIKEEAKAPLKRAQDLIREAKGEEGVYSTPYVDPFESPEEAFLFLPVPLQWHSESVTNVGPPRNSRSFSVCQQRKGAKVTLYDGVTVKKLTQIPQQIRAIPTQPRFESRWFKKFLGSVFFFAGLLTTAALVGDYTGRNIFGPAVARFEGANCDTPPACERMEALIQDVTHGSMGGFMAFGVLFFCCCYYLCVEKLWLKEYIHLEQNVETEKLEDKDDVILDMPEDYSSSDSEMSEDNSSSDFDTNIVLSKKLPRDPLSKASDEILKSLEKIRNNTNDNNILAAVDNTNKAIGLLSTKDPELLTIEEKGAALNALNSLFLQLQTPGKTENREATNLLLEEAEKLQIAFQKLQTAFQGVKGTQEHAQQPDLRELPKRILTFLDHIKQNTSDKSILEAAEKIKAGINPLVQGKNVPLEVLNHAALAFLNFVREINGKPPTIKFDMLALDNEIQQVDLIGQAKILQTALQNMKDALALACGAFSPINIYNKKIIAERGKLADRGTIDGLHNHYLQVMVRFDNFTQPAKKRIMEKYKDDINKINTYFSREEIVASKANELLDAFEAKLNNDNFLKIGSMLGGNKSSLQSNSSFTIFAQKNTPRNRDTDQIKLNSTSSGEDDEESVLLQNSQHYGAITNNKT